MFCYKCGYKANDGDRFCKQCGIILHQQKERQTIKLTCEDCGGILEVDADKTVLTCPYCGSKKLIPENDEVTIARINKAADEGRMRHEKEMREYEEEIRVKKKAEQDKDDRDVLKIGLFTIIFTPIALFLFLSILDKL